MAAKVVQQTAQAAAAPAPASQSSTPLRPAAPKVNPSSYAAPVAARAKGVAKGAKRFGEAIWGPMAHTGSVLWLEITGLFFALFALFFGQNAYTFRFAWKSGGDHTHFLIYSVLTLLFAAFTFSQFYKARQREKKNRARRASGRS